MNKILTAKYSEKDVTGIISNNFFKDGVIRVCVNNETMEGDPLPGVRKKLLIDFEEDGKLIHLTANEGENFVYPKSPYTDFNTLLLTSCNRIEQVLLAIAVNKEIIKEPFNLVVVDCSTEYLNVDQGVRMHVSDDPYNLIDEKNYSPNWQMIENYVNGISKIKNFQMIHFSPRQKKQPGEANAISYGLTASSNLGSRYVVKLSGVCHLKYDVFAEISNLVGNSSVTTWKRTGFNERSTRVFAANPGELASVLNKAGWSLWVDEYDFIEHKFERIIDEFIPVDKRNHLDIDERQILVDEGLKQDDYRKIIDSNLKFHGLENSQDPWIRKFYENKIW